MSEGTRILLRKDVIIGKKTIYFLRLLFTEEKLWWRKIICCTIKMKWC